MHKNTVKESMKLLSKYKYKYNFYELKILCGSVKGTKLKKITTLKLVSDWA